jgi:hypothetical protein
MAGAGIADTVLVSDDFHPELRDTVSRRRASETGDNSMRTWAEVNWRVTAKMGVFGFCFSNASH